MKTHFTYLLLLLMLGATTTLFAQADGKIALDYLQKEYASFGLEATDINDLRITDNYASPSGTRHIYVVQELHGLPILNAQASLHFRGDKLVYRTSDLATGLASVLPPAPALSAQTAIVTAVNEVVSAFGTPMDAGTDDDESLFNWPAVSPKPIRVNSGYYVTKAGPRLAYTVLIDRHAKHSDVWYIVVDAANGDILEQSNQVTKCSFDGPNHEHNYDNACANVTAKALPVSEQIFEAAVVAEESSYLVFPFGEESPLHGERSLEKSPSDAEASPFGWHDTNGQDGPEFTTTRGNNVWAYPDRDGNNIPDTDIVAEGGDTLKFVEFYDNDANTDTIVKAALVQTFYTTSILHDWLYHAGFDEAAGNFQRENYSGDGFDRDEVLVEVQDGSGTNNANFFTPADGTSGRMQMFIWSVREIEVLSPASLAGDFTVGLAGFGGIQTLTAKVVPGMDESANPDEGCEDLVNPETLAGNIALINRGTCFFEQKVFNAQEAGAVAVIICNNVADPIIIDMAEPEDVDLFNVTIPSVMLSMADCVPLRMGIENGEEISVIIRTRDGDFDNGIVAHELGHGVSKRLVGGPSNSFCLDNNEQMGEGWSDFFAVASTPRTNDADPDGTEPRGIGNFVIKQGVLGGGIRTQPYSTDMAVNTHTYDNVIFAGSVHALGEIWNTMLWDLYWAMVDEYGYDNDLITGTGGNNLAVQLVVEGLKFTNCNPGFVDGRDGILAADFDLNDGANQCLIWEVFARRGLGFSASQGETDSRTDGREAFDLSPTCPGGIGLTKTVDENTINAGEGVTYTLTTPNARTEATENVVITDVVPSGMTIDAGSIRGVDDFTIDGQTITFNVGTLEAEEEKTIRYSVSSDPSIGSSTSFYDGAEESDDAWFALSQNTDPDIEEFFWEQVDTTPYLGDFAYYVVNVATAQDQVLRSAEAFTITGEQPILRFFTKYETEIGWDAGIVEVSTDETNWQRVEDKLVRGSYRGRVSPNGAAALQNTVSFWGNSADEPDANARDYREIIVDMGDFVGQDVFVRYRFVSDAAQSGRGWWIDEIQMLDAENYESTATLTSGAGDNLTAEVGNYGVLVLNAIIDDVNDPALGETKVNVYPNPAEDFVTVKVTTERAGSATVQLMTIDGRVLRNEQLSLTAGGGQTTLNTADLPAGMYVVQVTGANRVSTTKVTIN